MRPAMKRYSLILLALLSLSLFRVAAAVAATAPVQPGVTGATDPLVLVQGTWDRANGPGFCQDNPQTLTLSADRTEVKLEFKKPVTNTLGKQQKFEIYKILDARARVLHTMVIGEPRKDPKGQPVTWDFFFASDNSFCWHRSDWPKGQCSATMMVRCPGSARP
jgi:hypothetical protein